MYLKSYTRIVDKKIRIKARKDIKSMMTKQIILQMYYFTQMVRIF